MSSILYFSNFSRYICHQRCCCRSLFCTSLVCDALHLCNRVMLVYTQKIEFLSTLQYSVCVCCSRLKKNWEPLCLLALVVVSAFITAFLIISLCHKRRKFLLFLLFACDMYPIRMLLYITYFQFCCGGGGGGMQAIPNWHQSFLKETSLPPSAWYAKKMLGMGKTRQILNIHHA